MLAPFPGLTIYMLFHLSVNFYKIWFDEVEDIAFITPAWKSSSILPSLLDFLIDDPIFIPSHQLADPCQPDAPSMSWCGPFEFAL